MISTSLQSSQQKQGMRPSTASTIQTINTTATPAPPTQGQISQPTVLTQRQGLQPQITVQSVPTNVSTPTQLTPLPAGVTILRPQKLTSATSMQSTVQATQILSSLPSSAAAVVNTIRQPLPASTLQPQGSGVSVSPSALSAVPPMVQLPTQPIPPNEIRTTKQVLLEPKAAAPKIAIPTTSPRTTSITLPTQPVPMSTAMAMSSANGVPSSSVTVSSVVNVRSLPRSQVPTPASVIQGMLPNQPLPMATTGRPGATIVTASNLPVPTSLQYSAGFGAAAAPHPSHLFPGSPAVSSPLHSPNMVTVTPGPPPRLPQHPLPPTTSSVTACKIEPVDIHAHPQPRTVVALKKRDIMMTKDLQNEIKAKEDVIVGMAKASIQSQPEYLKPRDAYGGGAHLRQANNDGLIKEEKPGMYQPQSGVTIVTGQSQPSSAPYSQAQLQAHLQAQQDMIAQEINLYYQQYLKQGQPEHMAQQLANQMVENRYANLKSELVVGPVRPGSVPPPMDSYRPPSRPSLQPPMAHAPATSISVTVGPGQPPDTFLRQSESPLPGAPPAAHAAHAHSRIPYSLGHPGPGGTPDHILQSYRATGAAGSEELYHRTALEPSPASPTGPPINIRAPSPMEFVLPNFESYPVVWQGHLGLKTEIATVQFHYVSGCKDLARASLPTSIHDPRVGLPTLKIGQRMRLEESQLSGVQRKMTQNQEHCVLLALPCGKDNLDVEAQSRQLRSHFITYLQLKSAAGIVNVEENGAGYVVHVFPSCDFANETMSGIAPDLLARVAEIEHMVIIIATCN